MRRKFIIPNIPSLTLMNKLRVEHVYEIIGFLFFFVPSLFTSKPTSYPEKERRTLSDLRWKVSLNGCKIGQDLVLLLGEGWELY